MQPFAQHVGQRAVVGLGDVGDLHARGVGLGSRAHRTDQRQAAFERRGDERQLGRQGVYGIHHVVVPRRVEQRVGLLVADVAVHHAQVYFRVDVAQPFGEHLGLRPPDGRVQRHELAVDVRSVHRVGVGHGHAAHARPGDHLRGVGPHASQPHHEHVRPSEAAEFLFAEQQLGPLQPVVHAVRFRSFPSCPSCAPSAVLHFSPNSRR